MPRRRSKYAPGYGEASAGEAVGGLADVAMTIGSGMMVEPAAGLTGIAALLASGGDLQSANDAIDKTRETWTREPKTAVGQDMLQDIGEFMAPLEKGREWLGDENMGAMPDWTPPWLKATAGTVGHMLPEIAGTMVGAPGVLRAGRKASNALADIPEVVQPKGPGKFQGGSFGGARAASADPKNFAKAESMKRQGDTPESIKKETGLEEHEPGVWKTLITDEGMSLGSAAPALSKLKAHVKKKDQAIGTIPPGEWKAFEANWRRDMDDIIQDMGTMTLGDIKHDKLYSEYPHLKDVALEFDPRMPKGTYGSHNPAGIDNPETVKVNPLYDDYLSTINHESVHSVDEFEGVASGSNAIMADAAKYRMVEDLDGQISKGRNSPEYKKAQEESSYELLGDQDFAKLSALERSKLRREAKAWADAETGVSDLMAKRNDAEGAKEFDIYENDWGEGRGRASQAGLNQSRKLAEGGMFQDDIAAKLMNMDTPFDRPTSQFIETEKMIRGMGASDSAKMSAKKPKRSAAETLRQGFKHPLGLGKNTRKPIDEYSRTVANDPNVQADKDVNWDELVDNKATFMNANTDRTAYGSRILSADGVELDNPVDLDTGMDFMKGDYAWASNPGVIKTIKNRIDKVEDRGRMPVLTSVAMAHDPTNFNHVTSNVFFEMIKNSGVSKTQMGKFDKAMRKVEPRWKTMDDPESNALFHNVGEVRKKFMNVAGGKEFERFFPDQNAARYAVTHPDMMDVGVGNSGQQMVHTSGNIVNDVEGLPQSFNTALKLGDKGYVGGIKGGVPKGDFWKSFTEERRADPEDSGSQFDDISMRYKGATQDVDAAYVDGLMDRMERLRQKAIDPNNPYLSSPKRREAHIGRHGAALPENFLKNIDETGGASVEAFSGRTPQSGFAMAKHPNTGDTTSMAATPDALTDYMKKNAPELSEPGTILGAWKHKGDLYVEPSKVYPTIDEAIAEGRKTDQIAGYDLNDYSFLEDVLAKSTGEKYSPNREFLVDEKAIEEKRIREALELIFNKQRKAG